MDQICRKLKQNFEGLESEILKHPSFFVTQVLSMLESLLFFISALVLGMLEFILLSSLLVQILGMLGPDVLLPLAQVLSLLEPIFFTSEVHVLSMCEPLFFLFFLKHFLFFLKTKNCNGMYNEMETGNCNSAEVVFEHPAIDRTPKQLCTI